MALNTKYANPVLALICAGFAAAYMLTLSLRPYTLSYLVKAMPIFSLSVFALLNLSGTKGKLLFGGLLFSGIGDILLDLPGKDFFLHGMGAFTLAHLFYIAVFLSKPALTRARGVVFGGIIVYCLVFGAFLFPYLGTMMLPIYIYLGVISIMGITACLGQSNHGLVIWGACFFIVSDSMIAYNMFISPLSQASFLVMTTYYLAQASLAWGSFLTEKKNN